MTCAHVISELGDEITLDFPVLSTEKKKASAKRIYPVKENPTIGDIEDIAVLELLSNQELPNGASPATVKIEDTYDHEMSACGFPKDKPGGSWIDGVIKGGIQDGRIQFDQITDKKFVKQRFSGTAVWDKKVKAVVGMVVAKDTDSDGISTGYMFPGSTLIKAWPELGSKVADTSETKSTKGRFEHKMCNRGKQVGDFEKFFDKHKEKIISGKKPPQIYIIHGREDECHHSLVERFQHEKIKQFKKITFNDTVMPSLEILPLEFDGDLEARKDRLSRNLFKLFDENYPGSDFSNRSFREFCIEMGLNKHGIIMLSHDIVASKWDEDFKRLVIWYINDFWAGFKSSEDTPQFLIFLNVKYHIIEKGGIFKSFFKINHSNKKISESLDEIQQLAKPPCQCLKIEELRRIERGHITNWYSERKINVSEYKKGEMINKMFNKEKELCMAYVEEKLEEVVKSVSPRVF